MQTINDVKEHIPHREPFLFVDEIIECNETQAVAKTFIDPEAEFFKGHYPGNPIMPGVLLCEAIFQTGAYFLSRKLKDEGPQNEGLTPVLSRVENTKFKSMIKPGDTITITAKFVETVGHFHFMEGYIEKDGKKAVTLKCALALVKQEN